MSTSSDSSHISKIADLLPKWSMPQLGDIIAGLSVAGLLLPEAVAYANIAGITPIHALSAALIGLIIYMLLGSCRQAIVSPTSSAAAIFASAAVLSPAQGFALLVITGILFVIAAWLRAGFIGSFISRPVMQGFAWSLAISIMLKQLPHLLGIETSAKNFFPLLWQLIHKLPEMFLPSAALGITSLAIWLGIKHLNQRWLSPSLVVLVTGTLLSYRLDLSSLGVKVVGNIPLSNFQLNLPILNVEQWLQVFELAPALLLIIFAESWESVKMLSTTTNQKINANQELLALGMANFCCGITGSLPVGAGYSACNASLSAGTTGKWGGIFTAIALAVLLWIGRPALAVLPIPVLAAVVLGILSRHFYPAELITGLKLGADSWLALVCVVAVLVFGVMFGMVLSVGISLLLVLYHFSQPILSELGQQPHTHNFVDLKQHANASTFANILIVRPEEPLFFANTERILDTIQQTALARQVKFIIISMEASDDLDATSLYALHNFIKQIQSQHQHLIFARLKDKPRQALAAIGLGHPHPPVSWYWSVDDAVKSVATAPKL